MNSKKILALILAVMTVLAIVPVVVSADETVMTVVGSVELCGPGNTGWGWNFDDTTNDMTKYAEGKYFLLKENVVSTKEEGQKVDIMIVFNHEDADYYGANGLSQKVDGVPSVKYAFNIPNGESKVLILLDTTKQGSGAIEAIVNPTAEQIPTVGGEVEPKEEPKKEEPKEKDPNADTGDAIINVMTVVALVLVAGAAVVIASKKKSYND